MQEPLKLHIGGVQAKEGWKILNIAPGDNVDYVGSCTSLQQFADGSVAEIYASHVIEHLSHAHELMTALREMARVLKKGGLLYIGVPYLENICRIILDPKVGTEDRFRVIRVLFGSQSDEFDFHKSAFTFDVLAGFLAPAGFSVVRRVESFDIFDDCTSLKMYGVALSLNVIATR